MMSPADPTSPQAHHRRPVAQYTDDGRWVASFPSMLAAHKATGVRTGNISTAALGRRWRAGGYIWRIITDGAAPERITVNGQRRTRRDARRIVQCDRAGNVLAEFDSALVAARVVGIHRNSIRECAHRNRNYRTAGGFLWRWADDPDFMFDQYRRTRDVRLRNALVVRFMSVVHAIARKLHSGLPLEVQYDDLVSAGTFGLMRAIDGFDPGRGVKFPAYSGLRVRGAMLDGLRDVDYVPRLVRARTGRVTEAARQLRAETGRAPGDDEVRERLGVDEAEYAMLTRDRIQRLESLSRVIDGPDGKTGQRIDMIEDRRTPRPDPDPRHDSLRDVLLKHFSLTDALLVRLYYLDEKSHREIGEYFRLCEASISFRHKAIRERLGALFTREKLAELIGGRAA